MRFTLTNAEGYLRADLYDRQTPAETRQFWEAVAKELASSGSDRILVSVHKSRAIFKVQEYALDEAFGVIAPLADHRVALVSDDLAVRLSQQYVATLAKSKGLAVRSFESEDDAVLWLRA